MYNPTRGAAAATGSPRATGRCLQLFPGQERDSKPPRYTPKDRSAGVQKGDAANVSVRGAELGTGARARQRSLLSSEMWH